MLQITQQRVLETEVTLVLVHLNTNLLGPLSFVLVSASLCLHLDSSREKAAVNQKYYFLVDYSLFYRFKIWHIDHYCRRQIHKD